MTDAPSQFESLLALQEHDTRIDQLRHRRATLAEREELDALEKSLAALERVAGEAQAKLDAAGRDQKRREDEVASIEAKITEIDKAMYGGGVTSPRELQTMQEEIDSLKRRNGGIEDEIIELMEYAEPIHAELGTLSVEREGLDVRAQSVLARLTEQEVSIDAELDEVVAARAGLASMIPTEVLSSYEGLRASRDGIAVARLERGTCGGCHLALPAAELDRIRRLPEDEVVHCEDCGRLLVR